MLWEVALEKGEIVASQPNCNQHRTRFSRIFTKSFSVIGFQCGKSFFRCNPRLIFALKIHDPRKRILWYLIGSEMIMYVVRFVRIILQVPHVFSFNDVNSLWMVYISCRPQLSSVKCYFDWSIAGWKKLRKLKFLYLVYIVNFSLILFG